ncbi:Glucans biosynthesis glucosyltransferase H, partial [Fusarium oxysporum f. sp. albedinis]
MALSTSTRFKLNAILTLHKPVENSLHVNMSSNSMADLVGEYVRVAQKYHEKAISVLRKQLEYSETNTRTREDVTQIVEMLEKCTIQKPLTAREVLRLRPSGSLSKKLVVCSEDDARKIFDKGPPCFPVLVVESSTQQHISIDWFLGILETR